MASFRERLSVGSIPHEEVLNSVLGCFLGAYLGIASSEKVAELAADPMRIAVPLVVILGFVFSARELAKDLAVWHWDDWLGSLLPPMLLIGLMAFTTIEGFTVSQAIWPILLVWLLGYAFLGGFEALRRAAVKQYDKNVAAGIYDKPTPSE